MIKKHTLVTLSELSLGVKLSKCAHNNKPVNYYYVLLEVGDIS